MTYLMTIGVLTAVYLFLCSLYSSFCLVYLATSGFMGSVVTFGSGRLLGTSGFGIKPSRTIGSAIGGGVCLGIYCSSDVELGPKR